MATNDESYVLYADGRGGFTKQWLSDVTFEAKAGNGSLDVRLAGTFVPDNPSGGRPDATEAVKPRGTTQVGRCSQIALAFEIDPVTRAIGFGSHDPIIDSSNYETLEPVPIDQMPCGGLNLGAALFGYVGSIYGVADSGRWVSVYSNDGPDPTLCFSTVQALMRNDFGFVGREREEYPRLWLNDMSLSMLLGHLNKSRSAKIVIEGTNVGSLDVSVFQRKSDYETGKQVERTIDAVELICDLNERGLRIAYRVPGSVEGECTLSWEILIIRYRQFAGNWKEIWLPA